MSKSANPGIVIAIFLNVILLLGLPYLPEGEVSRLAPLILMALVSPWLLAWGWGAGSGRMLPASAKMSHRTSSSRPVLGTVRRPRP